MSDALHLVRMVLDRRALARVAMRHRLALDMDEGYVIHAGLSQLFATSDEPASVPLGTFAVDDTYAQHSGQPDLLYLLGYAPDDDAGLRARMNDTQHEILRACTSRAVPDFRAGQRVGFRTRVCPIVRTKRGGDRPLGVDKRGRPKSREIDAFMHATIGLPRETVVSREAVYLAWLRKQLEASGACLLEAARLDEFRREIMRRKGGEKPIERPNAVLVGTLTVVDPARFRALVARGLGRHRAFGFGMLLLRAADSA